ncbi:hypothetical protein YB2330_003517 [Saitoella coloradoensis]
MTNALSGISTPSSDAFTVCVYCGSGPGNLPIYAETATALGSLVAARGWSLVYGGGTTGLMGTVSSAVAAGGGFVHGVIPQALVTRETSGKPEEWHGKTTIVPDMHTRKRLMAMEAKAFIALPGGYGTMEELFEAITWSQLGIHSNPIVLLNINGFYNGIVSWIENAVEHGFVRENQRNCVVECKTVEEVVAAIEGWKVPEGRLKLSWQQEGECEFTNGHKKADAEVNGNDLKARKMSVHDELMGEVLREKFEK